MYCKNCGHKNQDGMLFCENCGTSLNQNSSTSLNPKEAKKKAWKEAKQRYKKDLAHKKSIKKRIKKNEKKAKLKAMSTKQRALRILIKFLIVIVILGLLFIGGYLGAKKLGLFVTTQTTNETETHTSESSDNINDNVTDDQTSTYSPPKNDMPKDFEVSKPDADEYFNENSEIINQSDAEASSNAHSEAETYSNLTGRGFSQNPITTKYLMDGSYIDKKEISSSSSEKHPSYETIYITELGNVWNIFEINGIVMANPVFYNAQSDRDSQLIISESETIMSYDSTLNKFYETKPYESVLTVKVIDSIDASTLDSLTREEIDNL